MTPRNVILQVFTDPTNTMYHLLTSPKQMVPAIRHEPGMDCEVT